jgi:hypothetical protein
MPTVDGFTPSTSGFHFANSGWPHVPVMNIKVGPVSIPIGDAANGLCGGMAFAARDYFEAGRTPPETTVAPGDGPLFGYIARRLIDSFDLAGFPPGPTIYLRLMDPLLPDHETWASAIGLVPHSRVWIMIKNEWPKIRSDIDQGRLSPLGLIKVKSANPLNLGRNHQVLAYGYDLDGTALTLHIYDPNYPDDDAVTLSLDIGNPAHPTAVRYSPGETIYCFFRTGYSHKEPARADNSATTRSIWYRRRGRRLSTRLARTRARR